MIFAFKGRRLNSNATLSALQVLSYDIKPFKKTVKFQRNGFPKRIMFDFIFSEKEHEERKYLFQSLCVKYVINGFNNHTNHKQHCQYLRFRSSARSLLQNRILF